MRICFLATGSFAVPVLRAVDAAGHEILTVVSQPDRPAGRGRKLTPTPMHALADELGLPHIQAADVNALDPAAAFGDARLGVVVDFGQRLGRAVLSYLPLGCVNIHGSLLPKYRGAAPVQHAILAGETVTGVTAFQLNERWDAGAILGQRETQIGETETADDLHERLALLGAGLMVETIAAMESGRAAPRPQDPTLATRAPKLSRADGRVDWSQPAGRIVRRIHAMWSWPAVSCLFSSASGRTERVLLARAQVSDSDAPPGSESAPGTFCADLSVQTGAGRVRLLEVQPAGGRRMSFAAYANGRRIGPGDHLLPVEPS